MPSPKNDEYELPSSVQTEVTVLGAMLLDIAAIEDSLAKLRTSDFALDSHQRIFKTILELRAAKKAVDLITVRDALQKKKELDAIGGVAYLAFLTEGIPRNPNVESYIRIVKEKSLLRQLLSAFNDGVVKTSEQSEDPNEVIEQMQELLRTIGDEGIDNDLTSISDFFSAQGEPEAMFDTLATINGINLGFAQLHEITGGPQPGELWVVAGRPSMGKTAWMANVAQYCALQNEATAVFTLEQKTQAIVRRMLSSASRIDYQEIRRGNLRPQDKHVILERRKMLEQASLYFEDRPKMSVSRIRAKSSRQKRKKHLKIVFIDQLSKLASDDVRERGMDLRQVIGKQTNNLKVMAQELDVPVVLFCQLRRHDGKGSVVPTLNELKESGNIEEDADVVVLLHRPEYYDKADEDLKGKGQMIVAKNREGETKTCHCTYNGRIMRWEDAATAGSTHKQSGLDESYWTPI